MINLGKPLKTYGSAALIVNWPKETVEGKWLLYLMKIDSRGLEQITCSPEREINSLAVKEVRKHCSGQTPISLDLSGPKANKLTVPDPLLFSPRGCLFRVIFCHTLFRSRAAPGEDEP